MIVRLSQPLADGADADAVTRLGPGGQAANVAAWVAELGGESRFVGKLADDEAGRTARGALERYGAEVRGPLVAGRTGTIVSLVDVDGSRTMASDRGVSPELHADELDPSWLDGCTHLHLPGYSLLRSPIDGAALRAAESAPRLSVDLSSWSAIRDFGPERFRERLERAAAGDRLRERGRGADPRRAARRLHLGAQARPARRAVRRPRAAGPPRGGRSTRRAPAMRSQPATSSAGRSSPSPRRRVASRN